MRMLLAAALLFAPVAVQAQEQVIRIWGTPAMLGAAERWADAYEKQHPGTRFEFSMKGSDSAIHGLVGGVADIALIGREKPLSSTMSLARPIKAMSATPPTSPWIALSDPFIENSKRVPGCCFS